MHKTTNCYAYSASNSGCAVVDPSVASYGTQFNVLKGGVYAMMWLDDGIRICESSSKQAERLATEFSPFQGSSTALLYLQISKPARQNQLLGGRQLHSWATGAISTIASETTS